LKQSRLTAKTPTEVVQVLTTNDNIDWLHIVAGIRTLDPATALPQVVITGYSGGAHCCTSTAIATTGADGTWKFVITGQIDGGTGYNFSISLMTVPASSSTGQMDSHPMRAASRRHAFRNSQMATLMT
jgi:hypothetical protein